MLETLDPYTVYMAGKEEDDIDLLTHGQYGGVGISIGVLSAGFLELQVPIFDPQQDYNATRWRVIGLSRAEGRR
jgi:C-terminal processing protease CtpA/Prc